MRAVYSSRFKRSYKKAPISVQDRIDRAILLLLSDFRHPSLHAKIVHKPSRTWQARVTRDWRLWFTKQGDMIMFRDVSRHPK